MLQEIQPGELREWLIRTPEEFLILDVREDYEYEYGHLPSINIPSGEIALRHHEVPRHIPVVCLCRSGTRSSQVARYLISEHGFTRILSLRGGLLAWLAEVDPTFKLY
ncbi:MAG: rhodanese-like domain-containing protein [Flavobacteriales bacterium]|nr:rhodanese-like domain-containing protein [Flavobacteriales bacterium]MCX7767737.1 rhodanese-like domain-containing protein [Flavobacteriales bacterium]MDW8409368.1 rhodanese-like domain-containing protein [Flavobacteriales bacterium]